MVPIIGGSSTRCEVCHQVHRDLNRILGTSAPDAWLAVTQGERLEAELTPDVCILPDNGRTRHFVRGHIQLPIQQPEPDFFVWSVWVEVDEESMARIARTWSDPNRAAMPPLQGSLATELPYELPTRGLDITIYTRDPGLAPLLMISPTSFHTIAVEQQDGITLHRVAEFAELVRR